jgi:hypothetical protein
LPAPFSIGVWIFAREGVRQFDAPEALAKVFLVLDFDGGQVPLERLAQT